MAKKKAKGAKSVATPKKQVKAKAKRDLVAEKRAVVAKPSSKKSFATVTVASATPLKKKKPKTKTEAERIRDVHLLVEEHYESGKRLAWSFLNKWRVRIEEDEVISITGAALCEAANRFKAELGVNFKTFLFYYLRGMLLKEITKRVSDQKVRAPMIQNFHEANEDSRGVSLENFVAVDSELASVAHSPEELLDQKQRILVCKAATQTLDELEQKVLERFFADDESVVDIAKSLGYCRCHISRVKSKALDVLTDKLSILSPSANDEFRDNAIPRQRAYRGVRGRRKSFEQVAA